MKKKGLFRNKTRFVTPLDDIKCLKEISEASPHTCAPISEFPSSTVCPRSSDPFYIVSYYINWVTISDI